MATKIQLKLRKRSDSVTIPTSLIIEWMSLSIEDAKERLYSFFAPLQNGNVMVSDKVFLETTVNWVPVDDQSGRPKGLPLTEQVRWIKLAGKLDEAEDDGEIELSNKDIDMIWQRWNDKNFKLNSLPKNVVEFLMEFQEATNRWFEDLEDGDTEA